MFFAYKTVVASVCRGGCAAEMAAMVWAIAVFREARRLFFSGAIPSVACHNGCCCRALGVAMRVENQLGERCTSFFCAVCSGILVPA